ncbi:MAG TPA: aromatic ring-hydroxylating dioxygenase subunit alpha [Steroidobacteraceae bacterium]|nr:aromatic ring-hydroxylating dioxygenase subunit alpha [Steroidobacteraceae bacterium]
MTERFLERCWYFGGWSDKLANGATKEVLLAARSIVLYRAESGQASAIANRCPHRFSPLHAGRVHGTSLACPYHGLRFGSDGACTFSPHNNGAVPKISVPAYPVAERDGAIWIWMSQQAAPDRTLIPNLRDLTAYPATTLLDIPSMLVNAHYELMSDNLMDPSHADFVHLGKLGNGLVSTQHGRVSTENGSVKGEWIWRGAGPIPFLNRFVPDERNAETWFTVCWNAPGVIRLENGITPLGKPREAGAWVIAYHLFMPRDSNSTNYDVRSVRNVGTDDLELTSSALKLAVQLFNDEDRPLIEAQHRAMNGSDFWSLRPALLPSDTPSAAVRRSLKAQIEAEHAALVPTATQ